MTFLLIGFCHSYLHYLNKNNNKIFSLYEVAWLHGSNSAMIFYYESCYRQNINLLIVSLSPIVFFSCLHSSNRCASCFNLHSTHSALLPPLEKKKKIRASKTRRHISPTRIISSTQQSMHHNIDSKMHIKHIDIILQLLEKIAITPP